MARAELRGGLLLAFSLLMAAPVFAGRALVICDDVKDPMTFDPQKEFSEKNHTIIQQIFEGLVRFGPEGDIEPALATEWKRLDEKTVQFKLRRGVIFHDGEPFTAASVKFSIERYLDATTGFPAFGYISSLERVDVIDDYTVNIVTKYPDGLLLNRLAGFIVIVPQAYYTGHPAEFLRTHPVGTGAFRFKRWEQGRRLVLAANEHYWKPGVPKFDGLVFEFIPLGKQVEALLSGRLDVLTNLPGTRTLEVQTDTATYVIKKPTFYTVGGNFNIGRAPLMDKRVREAINLAIDRDALVRYDIFGNGVPIGTLSLPGEMGHADDVRTYPFDPESSRALLRQAGYPQGFDLSVLLKVNAERTGRILAKQLEKVGIRLKFTLVSDAELFQLLKDRAKWDIAIYDVPDPMHHAFFIRSIFLAGNSPFSLSLDHEIDGRLAALVGSLDAGRQRRISEDLDRYIHDQYLALPTYQRVRTYGVRRGVRFVPYKSGMPYFFATSPDADGL